MSYLQLVGAARFELTTPCAQGRCATRLRYAPTFYFFDSKPLSAGMQWRPIPTGPNRDKTLERDKSDSRIVQREKNSARQVELRRNIELTDTHTTCRPGLSSADRDFLAEANNPPNGRRPERFNNDRPPVGFHSHLMRDWAAFLVQQGERLTINTERVYRVIEP
jgi:hypothetical protein